MSFSNTDTGAKPADPYVEKNLDEPSLADKVDGLVKFVEKSKFCLLTTQTPNGLLASRCMALAGKENNGVDFIFHTNTESGKTDDLEAHSNVNLGFLNSAGEWASISGKATVVTDRAEVRKHYSEALKAWVGDLGDGKHDGGPEDPRIGLIKVQSTTVQYAVSRRSLIGEVIEIVKSVSSGDAPAVNKLRHLSEQELSQWRSK